MDGVRGGFGVAPAGIHGSLRSHRNNVGAVLALGGGNILRIRVDAHLGARVPGAAGFFGEELAGGGVIVARPAASGQQETADHFFG